MKLPRQTFSAPAFILIAVLIVIMLVSMIALSILFRLKAETAAATVSGSSEQAWAAAMAGVEEAIRVVRQKPTDPILWQDNPATFREHFVCDDGIDRWFFTVWSASDGDSRDEIRYGLTDEASKLNLNIASETNLLHLPRMTASLAQAILDFTDANNTALPEGAEQDYYDTLPNPYTIRNGTLSSIDELLLVRGFTLPLLYGEDANMNFILDANENDGDQTYPPDNSDGKLDLGLRPYVTVSSKEPDQDNDGNWRTNLNDPEVPLPDVELPPTITNFISLMRSNNKTFAHAADLLEAKQKLKDASGKEAEVESGVGQNELAKVLDLFSATSDETLIGLINVNTASAKVLATVPDINDATAESIVSARRATAPEKRKTTAWLYTEGLVNTTNFIKIAPYLTARSFQYSFHVLGYGVPSGRFRVLEVTIDLAQEKPAITYLRDLTKLGIPFRIELNIQKEASRG